MLIGTDFLKVVLVHLLSIDSSFYWKQKITFCWSKDQSRTQQTNYFSKSGFSVCLSELRDNISSYSWMVIKEKDRRKRHLFLVLWKSDSAVCYMRFPKEVQNFDCDAGVCLSALIHDPDHNPDQNLRGDQLHQWRKGSCSQGAREGSHCASHSRMVGSLFHRWDLHQRPKVSSSLKSPPWLPRTERRISFLDVTTDSTCPVCCPCQHCLPCGQSPVQLYPWILAQLLLPLFQYFRGPCSHIISPHWGKLGSLLWELREEGWTRISALWQVSLWGQVLGEKHASVSKVTLQ